MKKNLYITITLVFLLVLKIQSQENIVIENETITGTRTVEARNSIVINPNTEITLGANFLARVNALHLPLQPSANENYVFTRSFLTATTTGAVSSLNDVIENIEYYDGLGRAKQTIGLRQGGNAESIVKHYEYDDLGRQSKSYLPFVLNNTTVNHKTLVADPVAKINTFYNTSKYENTTNPYTQTVYEDYSPLSRPLEHAAQGNNWSLSSGHTIKAAYLFNTASDAVMNFEVVFDNDDIMAPKLVFKGYYGSNELHTTQVKNQNWQATDAVNQNTVYSFSDTYGNTVLTRTYVEGTDPSTGVISYVPVDNYNVYDDFGNLTFVLSPKAVDNILSSGTTVNTTVLNNLAYQYKYDKRSRLIERKVPGSGWEYIVYDKLNRPVLTQDAKLAAEGKWLFVKYDKFNRPVYSGMFASESNRADLQTTLNNQTTLFNETKVTTAASLDNTTIYYSNTTYPTSNLTLLNINYYDNYTFNVNGTPPNTSNVFNQAITTNVKGLTVGSKERILDTDEWIHSVIYYDEDARPVYTRATNDYLGTTDVVAIEYNFIGSVLKTAHEHSITQQDVINKIITLDYFTYDHQLRMLTHKQELKNGSGGILHGLELLEKNTYDELGTVTKVLVGNTEASPLQEVNYAYNIRGWLKTINDPNTNLTDDVFAMQFNYETNSPLNLTAKYDGSVSSSIFRTASDDKKRGYGYNYDAIGRLKSATYKAGNNFTEELNFYDLKSVVYDKNGNITKLERNAPNAAFTSAIQIDNLDYDYHENSNQLKKVTDLANNTKGFTNGISANSTDYNYDVNGNVTKDENKDITAISFNHLNLPKTITVNGQGTINFTYTATGKKMAKEVNSTSSGSNKTAYAGKFVYAKQYPLGATEANYNYNLKLFKTSQGYVEPNAAGTIYNYIYQYKDNQGNVRVSYTDSNNDGNIDIYRNGVNVDGDNDNAHEIVQASNYYPYGLTHEYSADSAMSIINGFTEHPYKYNGKEFSKDLRINVTEMDWRQYDNALGRFHGIDALAAGTPHLSPYHFANNNPITFSDPSGLRAEAKRYMRSSGHDSFSWSQMNYDRAGAGYGGGGSSGGSSSSTSNGGLSSGPAITSGTISLAQSLVATGSESSINAFNATYGASEVHGTHGAAYFNADGSADVFSYGGEMLNEVVVTSGGNYSAAIAADIYSRDSYDYLRASNQNTSLIPDIGINTGFTANALSAGGIYTGLLEKTANSNAKIVYKYGTKTSSAAMLTTQNAARMKSIVAKAKIGGKVIGGLGVGLTLYQYGTGEISGLEATVDTIMGVVGFIPGFGTAASIAYFGGKALYEYYSGETLFEKPNQ